MNNMFSFTIWRPQKKYDFEGIVIDLKGEHTHNAWPDAARRMSNVNEMVNISRDNKWFKIMFDLATDTFIN